MQIAVDYTRYSADRNQADTSTAVQNRANKKYIKAEGWHYGGQYSDEARSGTEDRNRPGYQLIIRDAAEGKFQILVVWKWDRFGRNVLQQAKALYEIEQLYGVKVWTSNDVNDDQMRFISLAFADKTAKEMRDRSGNTFFPHQWYAPNAGSTICFGSTTATGPTYEKARNFAPIRSPLLKRK